MKSPEQYEADLITLLASGPDGDDDADCLHCDMAVGLRGWNPTPDRVLRAAVADDRLWSILDRSRAAFKASDERARTLTERARSVLDLLDVGDRLSLARVASHRKRDRLAFARHCSPAGAIALFRAGLIDEDAEPTDLGRRAAHELEVARG